MVRFASAPMGITIGFMRDFGALRGFGFFARGSG
jgi:hypothetical protein